MSEIVDENMAAAARMHAVESGKDLGRRTMIAFGGNGPLHATRLARRAGLPARAVSGAVNRLTGGNVSQYVNGFRIGEACRLLADTEMSVTQAMLQSGFQTKSNFNREFLRVTGLSPVAWRQSRRQ